MRDCRAQSAKYNAGRFHNEAQRGPVRELAYSDQAFGTLGGFRKSPPRPLPDSTMTNGA